MGLNMRAHEQFHHYMSLIRRPLPEGTSSKVMMVELCQRVEMVLLLYVNNEFSTADGVLKLVCSREEINRHFVILEHDKVIAKFPKYPGRKEALFSRRDKDEQIIKMLRVIMCRFMRGRRGLHLYHPPYPEPELLSIEETEGQSYPRRFVRQEWMNWLNDCYPRSPHLINVAMRMAAQKLFPEGREGKTFKPKETVPEKGLEFEVFETKNI